jgi:hypothetical protein
MGNFSTFDKIWFLIFTFLNFGSLVGILAGAMCILCRLELNSSDSKILTGVIAAFCFSVMLFFSALYLTFGQCRFSKLILAIVFTICDLGCLAAAITTFCLSTEVLKIFGKVWTDSSNSAIVLYFEKKWNCCGFNTWPSHDCERRSRSCYEVLSEWLSRSSTAVGGVFMVAFVVLLVGVVVAYIRAFRQGNEPAGEKQDELRQALTDDPGSPPF